MDKVFIYRTVCVLTCVIGCIAKSGFILTAPKVLDAGSAEFVTFSLFNVPQGGSVHIRLLKAYSDVVISETTIVAQNNINTWGQLEIPDIKDNEARLQVYDSFNANVGYRINATKAIKIRHKSVIIFIQTDKPIYKPGQIVKFRILPMDNQLLPLTGITTGDVWIEDPSGIRMDQWKKVNFSDGIMQLELPLSEEPTLGDWTIHSRIRDITNSQTFRVDEYVLPKYDVTIIPPPYVMADAPEIPIKICAQYTYGKKVEGYVTSKVTYQRYSYENERATPLPFAEPEGPIFGCVDYIIKAEDILLHHREFGYRTIEIFAEVVEDTTGIMRNSTRFVEISHSPLEITFLGADKDSHFFKPGLPYYGELQLKKPDGAVAASEYINVCAKPKRKNWESNTELCNTFTSDKEGKINFIVPPQTATVYGIFVEAKSIYEEKSYRPYGVQIYTSYANVYLKPWHSPSNSHVQIEPITRPVQCDQLERVKIRYTTRDDSYIKFYHQVISRGRIAQQGSHHRTFAASDEVSIDLQDPRVLHTKEHLQSLQFGAVPLRGVESFDEDKSSSNKSTMIGEFRLSFDARATMSPVARLLVFYVREDGEVVADTRTFRISHCLQNQAKLHFRHPQQYPNTEAAMLLSASANSICGIGIIDKSVHLLRQEQKSEKSQVFELMDEFDIDKDTLPKQIDKDYCRKKKSAARRRPIPFDPRDDVWGPPDYDPLRRRKRMIMLDVRTRSEIADAMTAFEEAGMVVITDFTLENRPCLDQFIDSPYGRGDARDYGSFPKGIPYGVKAKSTQGLPGEIRPPQEIMALSVPEALPQKTVVKPPLEIRSFFPETWLWELHNVGPTGEMALKRELPHTITKWVGKAICIHPKTGLGISDSSSITTFQPFFVSLTLPYSVVRGEVVSMVVTVFNYLSDCLPIKLSLEASETFKIMEDIQSHKLCVCGEKSASWSFKIRPVLIGNINITVYAYSLPEDSVCENEITARLAARDAVTRQLLVEAEGYPKEDIINVYFCPQKANGTYTQEIDLLLPDNTIDDSARSFMTVTGDLMGQALSGLESLVRLPVGCGEQNMVLFTPNVYILDYLTATHRLTDEIRHKTTGYLKIGYQRELKYRHGDGSYSAFGKSDYEGSIWLTAFVVKSFAQARRFVAIDKNELAVSTAWIVRQQLENGCFPAVGELLNKALKGGLKDDSTSLAPLTAFILISLLESNYFFNETVNPAVFCLKSEKYPSTYSLALFAYATALAKSPDAEGYLHYLENRAIRNEHFQYWDYGGKGSKAINVEIAGYAVLAMLELGGSNSLARALPVVRWITQQRNSNGGFVSTQDTVVALQALAKYGSYSSGEKVDIKLTIESDELVQDFKVDETNKILMQSVKLLAVPTVVDFLATGTGCALAQFSLRYNVETVPEVETFDLKVAAIRSGSRGCNIPVVKICMRYNVPWQVTNMVIVEAKIISGYAPDEFELHMLHNDAALGLRRHDVKENKIIFYFNKLTNQERCFEFYLKNEINIENPSDAVVKMYDYYQPEIHTSTNYQIPVTCSPTSVNELPTLSPLPTPIAFWDSEKKITTNENHDSFGPTETRTTASHHDIPVTETHTISSDNNIPETETYIVGTDYHTPVTETHTVSVDNDIPETETYIIDYDSSKATETFTTEVNLNSKADSTNVNEDNTPSKEGENTNTVHTTPLTIITSGTTLTSTSTEPTVEEDLTNDVALADEIPQSRLFENFANVDEELNFPDGIEANQPVFIHPPENMNYPFENMLTSCPKCFDDFPENFTDLYCTAPFAIRISIRKVETGGIKILNDVSAQLTKPKAIKEYGNLIYKESCDCPNIKSVGNVYIIGLNDNLWQQSSGTHHVILNSDTYLMKALNKAVRSPQLKQAWKKCNE